MSSQRNFLDLAVQNLFNIAIVYKYAFSYVNPTGRHIGKTLIYIVQRRLSLKELRNCILHITPVWSLFFRYGFI